MRVFLFILSALLLLNGTAHPSKAEDAALTWSGEKTIDQSIIVKNGTLTIEPGTIIHFTEKGRLVIQSPAELLAVGTDDKNITFKGDQCGGVEINHAKITLDRCVIDGLGAKGSPNKAWLQIHSAADRPIALHHCQMNDCLAVAIIDGDGPVEITHCDIRKPRGGIDCSANGKLDLIDNTLQGASISVRHFHDPVTLRGNIIISGTISGGPTKSATPDAFLIESNFVHQSLGKNNYCLLATSGTIHANVFRGATWVSAEIGGKIDGNVFEAIPAAEYKKLGTHDAAGTHEQMCGVQPDAVITHNLFLHQSYGAIMGIGQYTCTKALIENNTFDMRSPAEPLYLNHLPKKNPSGIVVRNNLFLRCGAILDEAGIPDSMQSADYNLWGQSRKDYFRKVTITGKQPGDDGFGKHDIAAPADAPWKPEQIVVNPSFEFPFSDDEMLQRKHDVKVCLQLYANAYQLTDQSPARNAGDPASQLDPAAPKTAPDIGAFGVVKKN